MIERVSFRLTRKSWAAYIALKVWCRANRVPMGRMLNATLQAIQDLPHYNQMGLPKHAVVDIQYPKQTNLDDRLRYKRRLTRVKTNSNNE